MNFAYICDAVRTPIGRYGGSLSAMRPDDLGAVPQSPDGTQRRRQLVGG